MPMSGWLRNEDGFREVDGKLREVGLRESMLRAHELRQIECESPLETVSLYRLLVGLAHHLVGDFHFVKEWRKPGKTGKFEQVEPYFEQWADRSGLFDTEWPFWQCPGWLILTPKQTMNGLYR